jgi:hypothetical protein
VIVGGPQAYWLGLLQWTLGCTAFFSAFVAALEWDEHGRGALRRCLWLAVLSAGSACAFALLFYLPH